MSDETLPQPPETPEAPAGPYVYDYAASPQRQVVMPKTVAGSPASSETFFYPYPHPGRADSH